MFKLRALASKLGVRDHPGQGYSQPLSLTSLATQADSPDNTTRLRDHDRANSNITPDHQEDQRHGLQQTSNAGPSRAASHASLDSSHTIVAQGTQQIPHLSPSPSPAPSSASAGAESLVPDYDETKDTPRPPISESLGLWTCAVLTGGTALTLGVLGFLIFLWNGEYRQDGGEHANALWRKIMLDESWTAQSITISTAVLRIVVSAQAAVCTSLVAALLLERRRLPLSKAVPVSIKRGTSQGPLNFIYELLSWKLLKSLFGVEMALLLIITMVTIGTQFTSTILLSGFGNTTLVQSPQRLQNYSALLSEDMFQQVMRINSFSKFVPSYAAFGEPEEPYNMPNPNPQGVSDTGKKLRSFLPFQQQERLKLRSYEGPALTQDLRVMCMRPDMDAQISWHGITPQSSTDIRTSISGTISYDNTFEEAALGNWTLCSSVQYAGGVSQTDCLPEAFNCTLPFKFSDSPDLLPIMALCHLPLNNTKVSGTADAATPYFNASNPLWSASAYPWTFLTFATNMTREAVQENGVPSAPLNTTLADNGEWRAYEVFPNATLGVSLCFAGLQIKTQNVSMSTTADPEEPEVQWNLLHDEDSVGPAQAFMGTNGTSLTLAQRGLLKVSNTTDLTTDQASLSSADALLRGAGGFATTANQTDDAAGTWYMCNICDSLSALPPDISALFARTVHTTGRAAWAIQNLLTTYTQSWYAQLLPLFDIAVGVEVRYSKPVRIPVHPGGLIAVLVMVLVGLACIWAITVLYIVQTRYSRQGNVWHAVSQIISEDTRLVLEQSNQVVDKEVEERLKADDYLVFIGKPKGSEQVSLLRV